MTSGLRPVVHRLYGIRVRTPWPVPGVPEAEGPWDVEFIDSDHETLSNAASYVPADERSNWAQFAVLPDGSRYLRWTNLFEFLVTPDARQIHARTLAPVPDEAMLAYLLVDALSFSMVRLGWEPLHATAVLTPHGVAAFLGDSGAGKSTLAAAFVQGGARLVTDDMLILAGDHGTWLAQPGPPRIKLYRPMATLILGDASAGVPMNATTEKLILPVGADRLVSAPAPLRRLYLLGDAADRAPRAAMFERLPPARAFPAILANTAGHYPSEPDRLKRQLDFAAQLVREVPVTRLSYDRDEHALFDTRDRVLADLQESIDRHE